MIIVRLEQLVAVKWDADVCWAAIVAGNYWDPFLLSGHVQRFLKGLVARCLVPI